MLSKESLKEVEVDLCISFIHYEKTMYLIRSDGSFFVLDHLSVEECDHDMPDKLSHFL